LDVSIFAARDPVRDLRLAVKVGRSEGMIESLKRESEVHAGLNHPLILGFAGFVRMRGNRSAGLVTEFAGNGSLADHLSGGDCECERTLPSPTRVAIIVVGIAMAMRYLHSERRIHHNLNPATVFLDWDWTVRLGCFGCSLSAANPDTSSTLNQGRDARYTAPECFENAPTRRSDVFSFGLILWTLVCGDGGFWTDLTPLQVMRRVVMDQKRPEIEDSVDRRVRELIEDCWDQDPGMRPRFEMILDRLRGMDFEVTAGVNSAKVKRFFDSVEKREKALGLDVDDFA
jgi:serine/threonine protein kinase